MSIINRLKSLFKGDNEKEEADISNDVSNTSNDVEVTSSQKVEETIASEVKTEEDSPKDLTFKKDIDPVEDSSEEIVEEAEAVEEEVPEEVEAPAEAEPVEEAPE
jgi:heterodisulfide reductase subunit C